jgi:CMP-N-acetylneuraminic acid synthetase
MAFAGALVLAVVPARGGSKGIPRKNLQQVGGLSLVGRAGALAAQLPWLDAAVISTDDEEIAEEAERHGLARPFLRPDELASDTASSVEVWRHAWLEAERHYGVRFDVSILLEPTSPLRTVQDVEAVVRAVVEDGHAAAATVSPTPAHFTPHKTLLLAADGTISFYLDNGARFANRHLIPRYFHRNGLCYAVRRQTLVDANHIIEQDCFAVVVNRPVVNIDEPFELEMAEWLLRRGTAQVGAAMPSD